MICFDILFDIADDIDDPHELYRFAFVNQLWYQAATATKCWKLFFQNQKYFKRFELEHDFRTKNWNSLFEKSAYLSNISMLQWIYYRLGISLPRKKCFDIWRKIISSSFQIVQWFQNVFLFTEKEILHDSLRVIYAGRTLVEKTTNLETLKWFREWLSPDFFNLNRVLWIFHRSWVSCDFEIGEWIAKEFQIILQQNMNHIVSKIDLNLDSIRINQLQWLHRVLGLNRLDLLNIFWEMCPYGKLKIVRWIHRECHITRPEALSDENFENTFRPTYEYFRKFPVMKWLHKTYRIRPEEIKRALTEYQKIIKKNKGYCQVNKWIQQEFLTHNENKKQKQA